MTASWIKIDLAIPVLAHSSFIDLVSSFVNLAVIAVLDFRPMPRSDCINQMLYTRVFNSCAYPKRRLNWIKKTRLICPIRHNDQQIYVSGVYHDKTYLSYLTKPLCISTTHVDYMRKNNLSVRVTLPVETVDYFDSHKELNLSGVTASLLKDFIIEHPDIMKKSGSVKQNSIMD
jgi:hypothetical protein